MPTRMHVSVIENTIVGYSEGEDGDEVPEYGLSDTIAMDSIELTVRTDAEDVLGQIETEAVQILEDHGWKVTSPWNLSDNAAYATVERS